MRYLCRNARHRVNEEMNRLVGSGGKWWLLSEMKGGICSNRGKCVSVGKPQGPVDYNVGFVLGHYCAGENNFVYLFWNRSGKSW